MTRANGRGIQQDCAERPWPKQMRPSWRRLGVRVAPMKIVCPGGAPFHRGDDAARGGEGAKCVGPPRCLEIFEGHLLGGAPNPLARIVNKDIDRSEVRFDGFEGLLHHCWVAGIASIGAPQGEFLRQSAREGRCCGPATPRHIPPPQTGGQTRRHYRDRRQRQHRQAFGRAGQTWGTFVQALGNGMWCP